jgi:hypothetical protein
VHTSIAPDTWRSRTRSIGLALVVGAVVGAIPEPAIADCGAGDSMPMTNPIVTVIAGPGDAMAEQELWESLGIGWLEGDFEIYVGETFTYEAAP